MNAQVNQNTKPATQNAKPTTEEVKLKTLAELESEYQTAKADVEKNDYADEFVKKVKAAKAAIDKFNQDKQTNITNIKNTINGFGFTLTDIYSVKELNKAGFIEAPKTNDTTATTTEPKKDKAPEFIKISGSGVGDPGYSYKIGKIFTAVSASNKKPFQTLPAKLEKVATSFEELSKYVSKNEEAQKHFNTEAGKNEIKAIVEYVKNKDLKVSDLLAKFGPK